MIWRGKTMSGFFTKRRLAAALCAAVLCLFGAMALADEATPTKPDVFRLAASVSDDGVCTITVSDAKELPITVQLLGEGGSAVGGGSTNGNGQVDVSLTQSGSYHAVGWFNDYTDVRAESQAVTYTKREPPTAGAISADVSVEGQTILVTVR